MAEINKEEVMKEAKAILDSFSKALEKVKDDIQETVVERDEDRRIECEGEICDSEFRETMFKNAPKKKGDFIEAEKGGWI